MEHRYLEDCLEMVAGHCETARMHLGKALSNAETAASFAAENVDVQRVRKSVENGLGEALDGMQHLIDAMSYLVEAANAPMAPVERNVSLMEGDL